MAILHSQTVDAKIYNQAILLSRIIGEPLEPTTAVFTKNCLKGLQLTSNPGPESLNICIAKYHCS
jgi:hypothetical protein